MIIDPERIPKLAILFMNQDHEEEARLVNTAADAVAAYRAGSFDREKVKTALDALYAHTRAHFAREESAMLDASFPAYTFHQAEHLRILGELGEAERRFLEGGVGEDLATYLGTLPAWLGQHIQSMDAVTARYVSEWGG